MAASPARQWPRRGGPSIAGSGDLPPNPPPNPPTDLPADPSASPSLPIDARARPALTSFTKSGVSDTTPPRKALLLLALITLVWGTNWGLFPVVLREVSVWHFRTFTCLAAGLVLLAVARWRGLSLKVPRRHWATLVQATLLYLVVWNLASAHASALIPSGQAAVLGFTMPLWAALLAWGLLGQRLGPRLLIALALGALAVGLLAWRSLGAYAQAPLGVALALLAAIGWASGTMVLKRGQVDLPPLVLTGWQLLFASLPLGLGALIWGEAPAGGAGGPSWQVMAIMAYITLVPMAIGNLAWFTVVGLLPTEVAGLSSIMVPVVAMVSGAWLYGEPLGPVQLAAMACCAAALWLVLRKPG